MSDWKKQASTRRDARNAKQPEQKPAGKSKKSKNTKKYCKGKIGAEHKLVCKNYNDIKGITSDFSINWRLLVCESCGKELEHYFPIPGLKNIKPDWVDC